MQGLGAVRVFAPPVSPCGIPFHGSGVNDAGQVAGYNFAMGTTYQDGFVWTKASGMTLVIGSWPVTSIDDINNSGEVVGQVKSRR